MSSDSKNRHTAYIGIGSNLGDRGANIRSSIEMMHAHRDIQVEDLSAFYETQAIRDGRPCGDPPFINAAAKVETSLSPHALLKELLAIESKLGRPRKRPKDSARTIDLDILLYDDFIIDEEKLKIPHPAMTKRMFVLKPMCDIAPTLNHPLEGQSLSELKAKLAK